VSLLELQAANANVASTIATAMDLRGRRIGAL
jgi:hypothetical protein